MAREMGGQIEFVVASGKGGVGKSTISSSLAIVLAEKGYNIVAADADAEAPNLHLVLGVEEWDEILDYREGRVAYILEEKCTNCGICADVCAYGAVEFRDGKYWINPWICEGCITCSLACPDKAIRYRFKLKAGEIRISNRTRYGFPLVSGEITPGRPNSGKLVTEVKNKAKEILGPDGVVLVDAAAGIGCQVISSLTGAKFALLVVEPTPASFNDLQRIHRLTKHFLAAPLLVINKYDINESYVPVIEKYAEENNIPILGYIPYDDIIPKSIVEMKPVIKSYPNSKASKALIDVANQVANEVLANWKEWYRKYKPSKPEPYIPIIK